MHEPEHPLSVLLRETAARPGTVCVSDLMETFGGRAVGALILIFALICLLPLPPGATTIFGAPLLLLAPQLAFGSRAPWLPAALKNKAIKTADLRRGLPKVLIWVERMEAVTRPRLTFLFGSVGERLIGLVCTALAFVLILPIPLGNMLPAAAVSVLAFALIQRDGVLALVGYGLVALSASVLILAANMIARVLQHLVITVTGA